MKSKISVIIVHWNTPLSLKKLLLGLNNTKGLEVVVVDNHSKKSVSWVKKKFPAVHLIQNSLNKGYAAACNQGVVQSKGDWLLFLNPDIEISPNAILTMAKEAEKNKYDACSAEPHSEKYKKPVSSTWSLLSEFTPLKYILPVSLFTPKSLFGGGLMIKSSVLKKIGGWDERFFVWYEDVDLTKRLLRAGYSIGWVDVPMSHEGGVSFRELDIQLKKDIFFMSQRIYAKKHLSYLGEIMIRFMSYRFSKRSILPHIQNGVSITVPNMKKGLLKIFLEKNVKDLYSIREVIVVTSDIKPSNIWSWRKKYPAIRFIPITHNKGFAPTVNIGLRVSTTDWIGTINDDVELNAHWLRKCLDKPPAKTGSINPVIRKPDGSIESAGVRIKKRGKAEPITLLKTEQYTTVDATNAAVVMYSRKSLESVGLFDEMFGSYLEDIDVSLGISSAGYKNVVCNKAEVIHRGQSTSKEIGKKKQWLDFKNWILVIVKNWSLNDLIVYGPAILIERMRNVSGIIKNSGSSS